MRWGLLQKSQKNAQKQTIFMITKNYSKLLEKTLPKISYTATV